MVEVLSVDNIKKTVADVVRDEPKIKRVYLFGSFARGEQTSSSDIDFSLDTENGFTLIDASEIRLELTKRFGQEVDVVGLPTKHNKLIYDEFENDKVLLYER